MISTNKRIKVSSKSFPGHKLGDMVITHLDTSNPTRAQAYVDGTPLSIELTTDVGVIKESMSKSKHGFAYLRFY